MLRLVLFTIIMTAFLTGCGENNKFKAAEGMGGNSLQAFDSDDLKTTNTEPEIDYDNMEIPNSSENGKTHDQIMNELQQARQDKLAAQREVEALKAQQEEILEQGQAGIDEALEEGMIVGKRERDELTQQLANASQAVLEAEDRERAALDENQKLNERLSLVEDEITKKSDAIRSVEAELEAIKNEETEEEDISESLDQLEAAKTKLEDEIKELESVRDEINNAQEETEENSEVDENTDSVSTPGNNTIEVEETSPTIQTKIQPEIDRSGPGVQELAPALENEDSTPSIQGSSSAPLSAQEQLNKIMDKRFSNYNVGGYTTNTESNVVEGTESTTETQIDTMLNLTKIFTPSAEKKDITLIFSGVEGNSEDIQKVMDNTFSDAWNSNENIINSILSFLVSDCGTQEEQEFSNFSGWILPRVNANEPSLNSNCNYKALSKNQSDGSMNFVEIPDLAGSSFNIEEVLETVNPSTVMFITDLEKSDIENYNANDEKFSKYNHLMNLTSKLKSKTEDINGELVGTMNFEDGECSLLIISKTFNDEDFINNKNLENLGSKRCPVVLHKVAE